MFITLPLAFIGLGFLIYQLFAGTTLALPLAAGIGIALVAAFACAAVAAYRLMRPAI